MINLDILTRMRGAGEDGAFIQGMNDLLACCDSGALAVEIGAYAGQSTELILKSGKFERLMTVDPFVDAYDPTDVPVNKYRLSGVRYQFYQRILQYRNVLHLNLTSAEACGLFEPNSIDFLYIDGNHQYQYIKDDIDNYLPKMKVHGIMAGHDYNIFEGVNRAVSERFGKPTRIFRDSSWMVNL